MEVGELLSNSELNLSEINYANVEGMEVGELSSEMDLLGINYGNPVQVIYDATRNNRTQPEDLPEKQEVSRGVGYFIEIRESNKEEEDYRALHTSQIDPTTIGDFDDLPEFGDKTGGRGSVKRYNKRFKALEEAKWPVNEVLGVEKKVKGRKVEELSEINYGDPIQVIYDATRENRAQHKDLPEKQEISREIGYFIEITESNKEEEDFPRLHISLIDPTSIGDFDDLPELGDEVSKSYPLGGETYDKRIRALTERSRPVGEVREVEKNLRWMKLKPER